MANGMANGAELTRELAASGTGERKLAVMRKVLADVWRDHHRIASCEEVLDALEAADSVGEVTLAKARELAGLPDHKRARAAEAELPIEAQLLGDKPPPPVDPAAAKAQAAEPAAITKAVAKPAEDSPPKEDDEPKAPEFVGPKKVVAEPPRKK